MTSPAPSVQTGSTLQWHRISPISILFYIFYVVRHVGLQALPGLVVGAAALGKSFKDQGWILSGIVIALLLLTLFGLLYYLRFRYAVAEDRMLVQRGVLHREALDISFERIQNISIREPFYMRPFGLAVLAVDTAGSSGKEVSLGGVRKDVAEHIRHTIATQLDRASGGVEDLSVHADATQQDGELIVALERRDVLLYGLTANFLLWVALGVGFFFGAGDSSERMISDAFNWLQLDQRVDQLQARGGMVLLALVGSSLFLLALLIMPLLSMIGALFRYDGYRLVRSEDRYRCSRGLLSKHDESLSQHKIQAVVWKQNIIARLLGRINLHLRQASAGISAEASQNSGIPGAKQALIVPAQTPAEAARLSAEFLGGAQPEQAHYTGISRLRFTLFNSAWIAMLAPVTMGFSIAAVKVHSAFLLVPLILALSMLAVFYRMSGQYGLAADGAFGYHRSGFIGRTITVFPLFKVQRIDITQTPWQARRNLAKLTIHLASHSLSLSYLPAAEAKRFRDLAIYHAESSRQRWF